MRARTSLIAIVVALTAVAGAPARAADQSVRLGDAFAKITGTTLRIGTARTSRTWLLEGTMPTLSFTGETVRETADPWGEFTIFQGPATHRARFVDATLLEQDDAIIAIVMLEIVPGVDAIRRIIARPGARALYTTTELRSSGPAFPFSGYALQSATLADTDWHYPYAIAFNGGSDWRADFSHRSPVGTGATGEIGFISDQWQPYGVFVWMGRRGAAGSRIIRREEGIYAVVDHSYDLANLGPIEPYRIDNPAPDTAGPRMRVLRPGATIRLEDSAAGAYDYNDPFREVDTTPEAFALGREVADIIARAARPFRHDIVTNSWGSFGRNIDEASMLAEIDASAEAGSEVFVLDDGWQDFSGDWNPDPTKFPRGFAPLIDAARARGMRFGVWMSPLNFHPDSATFNAHPEWVNVPYVGASAIPSDSGFGVWSIRNPDFRRFITGVVERLTAAGAGYFKFDFMVWLDDANPANPGDYYDSHDAFVNWYDDLARRYPDVTFQLDETNDNRLFAFESVLRGPSWFKNGSPRAREKLAAIAQLSPFIPASTLGQNLLARGTFDPSLNIDQEMASGLLGHATFWNRMTSMPPAAAARVRAWTDLYKEHRALFAAPVVWPTVDDGAVVVQTFDPATDSSLVLSFGFDNAAPASQDVYGVSHSKRYRVERVAPGEAPVFVGDYTGHELNLDRVLALTTPPGGVDLYRITPA